MVQISDNGILSMNRGDTFKFGVRINKGSVIDPKWYELGEYDSLLFGVMEAEQPFECALIRKTYTIEQYNESDGVTMELTHEDTATLKPGTYYYEVKLVTETDDPMNPKVDTVIPRKRFFVYE